MAVKLFEPLALRGIALQNRIVVAPMTQFSADEGVAGDWHLMHLGQFAVSGAALIMTESTYVEPNARNNPRSLALYTEEQAAALGRIANFIHSHGIASFGVQLCHGGRKASSKPHWVGGGPLLAEEGGYPAVAPSPIPIKVGWPTPREMTMRDIAEAVGMFASATRRAVAVGADLIEIHGAHGYLIHQFLSPITNRRGDHYGGTRENRMRFATEVFEAVRAIWPADKPIGIRVSATDWIQGGWTTEDTVALAQRMEDLGCDYIHVSSGGLAPQQKIETGPGYQVGFAAAVKAAVKMPVVAVGQITSPQQAESILRTGQADLIALARTMLFNPRWPWLAAHELGAVAHYPPQYERADPRRLATSAISNPGNEPATGDQAA
ncbi:NADH:flavin oxidoreductase/NADH oxidase [Faunimonas sp. B44]|uniref:NADH:flavin oxidoreductase/NADH oxidase n=1 Tax=Faunimonas sp. B44 TaxID=3461493 RepID=UPI0040440BA8